jgi:hypothetical protein
MSSFGPLIKAVVDVERRVMAVGGELHPAKKPSFSNRAPINTTLGDQPLSRSLSWAAKGNAEYSALAIDRALELLDLTIADPRNRQHLKEITWLRETLLDYFVGSKEFASSPAGWHAYFHAYGMAAR